jgi:hypothetical protein
MPVTVMTAEHPAAPTDLIRSIAIAVESWEPKNASYDDPSEGNVVRQQRKRA